MFNGIFPSDFISGTTMVPAQPSAGLIPNKLWMKGSCLDFQDSQYRCKLLFVGRLWGVSPGNNDTMSSQQSQFSPHSGHRAEVYLEATSRASRGTWPMWKPFLTRCITFNFDTGANCWCGLQVIQQFMVYILRKLAFVCPGPGPGPRW